MKTKYIILVLAGLFFFSTTLEAQMRGGHGDRGHHRDRHDRVRLHDRLDLTSEQEAQLSELRTAHQKQMIDKRAEVQKLRLALREEMRKEAPDMTAVENIVNDQSSVRASMQLARVEHWNEIRQILTPEQQEIWQKHRRDYGEFGDRRGSGRRHSRGRW